MTTYGDWKIWNGGECPVDPETRVQVQFADGTRFEANESVARPAEDHDWSWGDTDRELNIIAYREVIEPEVERQEVKIVKIDGQYGTVVASGTGIVMDDKVVKLDLAWATIRGTSETGLAEYVLGLMRETRRVVQ